MIAAKASWAYSAVMLASISLGAVLSRRSQERLGLTRRQRLGIGLGAFCGGMIGAKLPFGLALFDNGKTILGGLVGGYLGVELAKRLLRVEVKTGDSFAVPVAAAIGVGRLSCFIAGCCYGTPTSLPWGVDFGDGLRRHPTQLYELGFHLSMAALLAALQRRGLFRFQLMKLYILSYLAYRFATEFIRPEPRLGPLTAYQFAALALIPVFAALWARDRRRWEMAAA